MFGTIRKHQTWLWAIIITLTIISFVVFFSPYSKVNNERRGGANFGSINGERISRDDYINAMREVELQFFFRFGNWPTDDSKRMGFDEERETYQWLFLMQKQRQMGIRISSPMAAETARSMLSQLQKQEVSPQIFRERVLQPRGMDFEDFDRFIRHYLGIQELIATIGLSGKLVTPQDSRAIYIRQHEELATEAVFFVATNYVSVITATPQAITNYYLGETNKYEIPDRVQVSYVKFDLTNFVAEATQELAKMTNIDQEIETLYRQNGTNLLRELKATNLTDAKVIARENQLKLFERQAARRKAAEFATTLFNTQTNRADDLDRLARSNGLAVKVTAPFDRDLGPKDIDVAEDFTKAAFALTPAEPFAPPLVGQDGAYVIAYNKQIPSEIPPLDKIRDKVTADYKDVQALMKARVEGTAFSLRVATNTALGKSFEAVCEEAKVKPLTLSPFSLSTRSLPESEQHVRLDQLKGVAFGTPPGKVSNFQADGEGGFILYVKAKLPVDESKINSELPAFTQNLRITRQQEAFNIWFSREWDRGMRDTPLAQRKQPNATMRPRKS